MFEKYSRARDNDGSMIIERSSEVKSSAVQLLNQNYLTQLLPIPRDLSSEVQSCYSSNPSQPLLCRDKVILNLLIIFKAVKFVKFYVSVQVAEFSQCVVDWRSQALKAV